MIYGILTTRKRSSLPRAILMIDPSLRVEHAADDDPRSMRDAAVRERRRAMLGLPHIAPLTNYAAKLRERGSVEVPDFDPLDGGVDARVLFLLEKPGPMTAGEGGTKRRSGSGFISRNNDDPTAEASP